MENACFFLEACRDLTTPLSSHRVVPMCANVELNGCSRDENKRLFCAHTWEQLQIMICSHVTYTFISTRDKHVVVCPVMMLSYAAKMIYPLGRQLLRIPFFYNNTVYPHFQARRVDEIILYSIYSQYCLLVFLSNNWLQPIKYWSDLSGCQVTKPERHLITSGNGFTPAPAIYTSGGC